MDLLHIVYACSPELFPTTMSNEDDIPEIYNIYRSMRRGSVSRAAAEQVHEDDQYAINRWSKKERSKGRASMPINHVYIDITLLEPNFLRYTAAM